MMVKVGSVLGMAVVFAVSTAATADAAHILRLTQGSTTVTVVDNGAGDSNPSLGAIVFIGAVGTFTQTNVTGLSKPVIPDGPAHSGMDLAGSFVSTGAGGTLLVELTDTGFGSVGPGTLLGSVGGTMSEGSVSFAGYKSGTNTEFSTTGTTVTVGPFTDPAGGGPLPYSGSNSAAHGVIGPYSMTLVSTILHNPGTTTSSYNFALDNFSNVPEPATLTLFGLGLIGAGVAARRRREQDQA
jgi:hypothetical protein